MFANDENGRVLSINNVSENRDRSPRRTNMARCLRRYRKTDRRSVVVPVTVNTFGFRYTTTGALNNTISLYALNTTVWYVVVVVVRVVINGARR